MHFSAPTFVTAVLLVCGTLWAEPPEPRWQGPPLQRSISIRDGQTDQPVAWDRLLDALAAADVVFLGEQHTDETSHRVQLAVYEELLARRQQRVVLALEQADPLAASSRFHRLRLARDVLGHTLPEVLARLEAEDRRNVLIVPGVSYAEASWMRELGQSVRDFRDTMTLHWLPGLGGRLPAD